MNKNKMKKYYILGIIMIVSILYILILNLNSSPFDCIRDMRSNVENYDLIDIKETDIGTMVYSVGEVNDRKDNVYFADMVVRSVMGYKWVGGGGHINRDLRKDEIFVFSAQLLNEEQKIRPTILGVFLDELISDITVITQGNESYDAIIYDGKNEGEYAYYILIDSDVSNCMCFIFRITYENGEYIDYIVSVNEIDKFQEGRQLYFY